MRAALLLCITLLTTPLLANKGDLAVTALTSDKSSLTTGERFNITVRVRNNGPDTSSVLIDLQETQPVLILNIAAPGWRCSRTQYVSDFVNCFSGQLTAGQEAELHVLALAPRTIDERPFTITARSFTAYEDPVSDNNQQSLTIPIQKSSNVIDLTVTEPTGTKIIAPGSAIDLDFTVANRGPGDARDLILILSSGVAASLGLSGDGWSCGVTTNDQATCTKSLLRANESSILRVHIAAPAHDTNIGVFAGVTAEGAYEPDPTNNYDSVFLGIGSADSWNRVLIPITATNIAGAFGSMWNTNVTMLFLADKAPVVEPIPCPYPCDAAIPPIAPLRRPFDARVHGFLRSTYGEAGGQFLYFKREDAAKVRFNARVYDSSRNSETAGSEMPIVRGEEFTSDTIALLNIPVAPQYRHMLRIYDDQAKDQTPVVIRVYFGDEADPRVTTTRTLSRPSDAGQTTSVLLPTRPAYAQLDLRDLAPLDAATTVRVEVTPADASVKLWAFVSITNNDTHHVTIVTPQ